MANIKEIRENARREIGKFIANGIKEDVRAMYKMIRESSGLKACIALALARFMIQKNLNRMATANFYGPTHLLK